MLNKNLGTFNKKAAPDYGPVFSMGSFTVGAEDVLQEPTVLACMRLISNVVASLSLKATPITDPTKSYTKFSDEIPPELAIILKRPNKSERTRQLLTKIVSNLVIHGEAFIQVKRVGKRVSAIECLPSGKCQRVQLANGEWSYTGVDNQNKLLIPSEIHYLTGVMLSNDGFDFLTAAKSIIQLSRTGIANATKFHSKGPKNAGFVVLQSGLRDEAYNKLRDSLDKMVTDDGGVGILEGGAQFVANPYSASDVGLADTRTSVSKDIAALLGVPLQLLGYQDTSTKDLNEIRAQFMSAVIDPLITEIEDVLAEAYDNKYIFDFMEQEVLNAAYKDRASIGMQSFSLGLISKNEARVMMDQPEMEDGNVFVAESNNLTFTNNNGAQDEV